MAYRCTVLFLNESDNGDDRQFLTAILLIACTMPLRGPGQRSRYSDSVRAERSGFSIPFGTELTHLSRPLTQPPVQCVACRSGIKATMAWIYALTHI